MSTYTDGGILPMFNRLISFGDSFILGNELIDFETAEVPYSYKTFPALMAKQANIEYLCLAKAAASNQYIAHKILDYPFVNNELCIVQWTYSSRFGIPLEHSYELKNNSIINWFDMRPHQIDEHEQVPHALSKLSQDFYKQVDIGTFGLFQSELCVSYCANYLHDKKVPYIFLCLDDDLINCKHINKKFRNMSFLNYCKSKNLPKAPKGVS